METSHILNFTNLVTNRHSQQCYDENRTTKNMHKTHKDKAPLPIYTLVTVLSLPDKEAEALENVTHIFLPEIPLPKLPLLIL